MCLSYFLPNCCSPPAILLPLTIKVDLVKKEAYWDCPDVNSVHHIFMSLIWHFELKSLDKKDIMLNWQFKSG